METKYGFKRFTIAEFEAWLDRIRVGRTLLTVQQHHTYLPNYSHFTGNNHFNLQKAMKNHHVYRNGWQDIGQHFTTFPDGTIVTGRNLEKSPACIYGFNANAICFEHLGNFDNENDLLNATHKNTIVSATAAVCKKFNIPVNTQKIVYHHWFDLRNGRRNNGTGTNKSCPGTNFFGGNKVVDCETHFIPLVKAKVGALGSDVPNPQPLKYAQVTANRLNIRLGPGLSFKRVADRSQLNLSAVLRIYAEKNGWLKISNSAEHWVAGRYTEEVIRATVTATKLNVRSGPATSFSKTSYLVKGTNVWVSAQNDNWCCISQLDEWVHKKYLQFN